MPRRTKNPVGPVGKVLQQATQAEDDDFWNDTAEEVSSPVLGPSSAEIPLQNARQGAADPSLAAACFALRCGGHAVVLLGPVGKDWDDVLVWNRGLGCTMHLQRKDLTPVEEVERAVRWIQNLK